MSSSSEDDLVVVVPTHVESESESGSDSDSDSESESDSDGSEAEVVVVEASAAVITPAVVATATPAEPALTPVPSASELVDVVTLATSVSPAAAEPVVQSSLAPGSIAPATKGLRVLQQAKLDKETGFNTHKIYIGNLPDMATLADLQDCFGQIGECTALLKRGYGFVVRWWILVLLL